MNTYALVNARIRFIESVAEQFGHEATLLEGDFMIIPCDSSAESNLIVGAILEQVLTMQIRVIQNYETDQCLIVISNL